MKIFFEQSHEALPKNLIRPLPVQDHKCEGFQRPALMFADARRCSGWRRLQRRRSSERRQNPSLNWCTFGGGRWFSYIGKWAFEILFGIAENPLGQAQIPTGLYVRVSCLKNNDFRLCSFNFLQFPHVQCTSGTELQVAVVQFLLFLENGIQFPASIAVQFFFFLNYSGIVSD